MLKSLPWGFAALLAISACTGEVVPSVGEGPRSGAGVSPFGAPVSGSNAPSMPVGVAGGGSGSTGSASGSTGSTVGSTGSASGGSSFALPNGAPDLTNVLPENEAITEPGCDGEILATDVRIRDIAFYQSVKIPVVEDGRAVTAPEVPLVNGKSTLVRVFVEPFSAAARGPVKATLTLQNGAGPQTFESVMTPSRASGDEDLGSTFNFEVGGEELTTDTAFSLALEEPDCTVTRGDARDARFPESGTYALEVLPVRKLRVVLVPVTVSGLTPSTSSAQVDAIREALSAVYPVPEVEVSVRAPVVWTQTISASGGWTSLLNEIGAVRQRDRVDRDVYYFGLVTPVPRLRDFCRWGCTAGIAPQNVFVSSAHQIGLGVGYEDPLTYETIVHELGHAHGLGHAPCAMGGGITGVDRAFPFPNGDTGSWGWDASTGKIMRPTTKDLMGYCPPSWIGEYNYRKLVDRSLGVNTAARIITTKSASRAKWRSIVLNPDGSASWGQMLLDEWPGGAEEEGIVRSATGEELARVRVARVQLSDEQGSFLYLPQPQADWASIQLSDRTLELSLLN